MNKSYAKKTGKKRWPLWQAATLIGSILVVFIASGVGVYFYKKTYSTNLIASFETDFNAWINERKKNLNQGMKKVKHMARKQDDSDIHFEFYTALPDMKMKLADFNTPEENKLKKREFFSQDKTKLAIKRTKKTDTYKKTAVIAMKSPITNVAELEADLSAHFLKEKQAIAQSQHSKGHH